MHEGNHEEALSNNANFNGNTVREIIRALNKKSRKTTPYSDQTTQ